MASGAPSTVAWMQRHALFGLFVLAACGGGGPGTAVDPDAGSPGDGGTDDGSAGDGFVPDGAPRDEGADDGGEDAGTDAGNPIVVVDDVAETVAGLFVDVDVLPNDTPMEGLTIVAVGTPTEGSAELREDGTLRYTAPEGFAGEATFSYEVEDAEGNRGMGTVTVTVMPRSPCAPEPGFTKTWTAPASAADPGLMGATGSDRAARWEVATNWTPEGVPAATDDVFVCAEAPVFPTVNFAHAVRDLVIEAQTQVAIPDRRSFLVNRSFAGLVTGDGQVVMQGEAGMLEGSVPERYVDADKTLSGDLRATFALVRGCPRGACFGETTTLTVGPHTFEADQLFTGPFGGDINLRGWLDMSDAGGRLVVHELLALQSDRASTLNAGELHASGRVALEAGAFAMGPGFRVFLEGTAPQAMLVEGTVRNVTFDNPTEVSLEGGFGQDHDGDIRLLQGEVNGASVRLRGTLTIAPGATWAPNDTSIFDTTGPLPGAIGRTLVVQSGTHVLAEPLEVGADLLFNSPGSMTLSGNDLTVRGNLDMRRSPATGPSTFTMVDELVRVDGSLLLSDPAGSFVCPGGRIDLGGSLETVGRAMDCGAAHTLAFVGTTLQRASVRCDFTNCATLAAVQDRPYGAIEVTAGAVVELLGATFTADGGLTVADGGALTFVNSGVAVGAIAIDGALTLNDGVVLVSESAFSASATAELTTGTDARIDIEGSCSVDPGATVTGGFACP